MGVPVKKTPCIWSWVHFHHPDHDGSGQESIKIWLWYVFLILDVPGSLILNPERLNEKKRKKIAGSGEYWDMTAICPLDPQSPKIKWEKSGRKRGKIGGGKKPGREYWDMTAICLLDPWCTRILDPESSKIERLNEKKVGEKLRKKIAGARVLRYDCDMSPPHPPTSASALAPPI